MSRISLSLKSAKALLDSWPKDWVDGRSYLGKAFVEVQSAISRAERPKRAVVAHKKVTDKKKRTRGKDTKTIRAELVGRSNGICECGCRTAFSALAPAEMDHEFGRVRVPQAVSNCWLLRADCHRDKTRNKPSNAYWLRKFIAHSEKHGLDDEAAMAFKRLESIRVLAEAEAMR